MKKWLAVSMVIFLLCSCFTPFTACAEGNKVVFQPRYSSNYTDGGYWANDFIACESYGDEGISMTGYYRSVWVFTAATVEKMPFLVIQVASGAENFSRITATRDFNQGSYDIDVSGITDNVICIDLQNFLDEDTSLPYVYISVYINQTGLSNSVNTTFSKLYLSDVKETQPTTTETTPSSTATQAAPESDGEETPTLPIAIAGGAAVLVAIVVTVVIIKKKK